jgi:hypothetical protein
VAVLERAVVSALSFTADAKGWIGLLDGTLGLNGNLNPSVPGLPAEPPIPFTVGGTIAQPVARPLAAAN